MIIARQKTPIPLDDLPEILDRAAHTVLDTCPGQASIALLMAHLIQEHGLDKIHDRECIRAVWCNNLGNIDATKEEKLDPELMFFHTVVEDEGSGTTAWTARHVRQGFASPVEGAIYLWTAIRERFLDAFVELMRGDAHAYVHALKKAGWFTGDVNVYVKNVDYHLRAAGRAVDHAMSPEPVQDSPVQASER